MPELKPDKNVSLTLDDTGLPVPDIDPIEIQKDTQKIKWTADFEFTIEVEDYTDLQYGQNGPTGKYWCKSGFFSKIRQYKYSITANGQTNDPGIDIKP